VKTVVNRKRRRPTTPIVRPAAAVHWPSEAEQTLEALRTGLIDALVIAEGTREGIYALKTFEELEGANEQLRQSQERLLMLLNERERLMQDLHDGCIQSIYAVGLALENCRSLIRQHPAQASRKIAQAEASLNLVIQELRAFISGVRPDTAVDLRREITRVIDGLGTQGRKIKVEIDSRAVSALPREVAAQLLQIAREGVSNVVRHARARSARVSLRKRGRDIRFEIADDGVGFDIDGDHRQGLGLHHIAARVQKLGGRLQLTSRPAKGCRVIVHIAT
jgi:signal transduction histidine kinase